MSKAVHVVPTAGYYIPGVPAVEQDVTPEVAAELLAYRPAAFTTSDTPAAPAPEPPAAPAEPAPADEPQE